jgi:hypothetical protein
MESDVSPVGYVDPRMWCEQSSIIFEHCSTLFEFRSISVDYVTKEGSTSPGFSDSNAGLFAQRIIWPLTLYLRIGTIVGTLGRKRRFRLR